MKKIFACILAIALMAITLAACGGDSGGGDSGSGTTGSSAGGGSSTSQSDGGGLSAYDQLMQMEDKLPLAGLMPSHLESRESIDKGLPVEPKEDVVVGWTAASLGSTFFVGMMDSAYEAAEHYGYTIIEQNANFDLALQQTHLDSFITQGVDVIMLNAVDLRSSTADIKRCVDAGIPVIVTGPTAAEDNYQIVTNILLNSNESGFQVGLYTAEKMYKAGEVLEVGLAITKMSDDASNSRPCGWISGYLYKKAEIDGNPYASKYDAILDGYNYWLQLKSKGSLDLSSEHGLNFVGVGENTDAAAGQKASSDILTASPEMDLLIVEQDSFLPGVIQEVKQHGRTAGEDITLVTCGDGTRDVLDYIKSGEVLATATCIPYYNGWGAMALVNKMFTGQADANNMPVNSYTPTICINPDNVDDYYDADLDFAKYDDWDPISIDEYNKKHAND